MLIKNDNHFHTTICSGSVIHTLQEKRRFSHSNILYISVLPMYNNITMYHMYLTVENLWKTLLDLWKTLRSVWKQMDVTYITPTCKIIISL